MPSSTMFEEDELFIPLNLDNFRLGGKKSLKTKMLGIIEPYISALIRASGISRHQAKTCFYYAVATQIINSWYGDYTTGYDESKAHF